MGEARFCKALINGIIQFDGYHEWLMAVSKRSVGGNFSLQAQLLV